MKELVYRLGIYVLSFWGSAQDPALALPLWFGVVRE